MPSSTEMERTRVVLPDSWTKGRQACLAGVTLQPSDNRAGFRCAELRFVFPLRPGRPR